MSVELMMSRVRVIEVTLKEPSLMLPSIIECEWQSMIPGEMNFPVASMTLAFDEAVRFLPILAILPFWISISVLSKVPLAAVKIVAFLIRTSCVCPKTLTVNTNKQKIIVTKKPFFIVVDLFIIKSF